MRVMLLLAAMLLTAGCTTTPPGQGPPFASFDEAMAAAGATFDSGSLRLKVVEPHHLEAASMGVQPVVVVLWEDATDAPLEDWQVTLEATMPSMGHGTTNEQDPVHRDHGAYVGQTRFSMPGEWQMVFDAFSPDGGRDGYFEVPVTVSEDDGHDHSHS